MKQQNGDTNDLSFYQIFYHEFSNDLFELFKNDADYNDLKLLFDKYLNQEKEIDLNKCSEYFNKHQNEIEIDIEESLSKYVIEHMMSEKTLEPIEHIYIAEFCKQYIQTILDENNLNILSTFELIINIYYRQLLDMQFSVAYFAYPNKQANTTAALINVNKNNVNVLTKELGDIQKKIDDLTTNELNDIQDKIKYLRKKIRKAKKKEAETSITILGIFASIILVFYGITSLASAIISNINQANLYKTVLITLLIGLITTPIFMGLIYYLNLVRKKTDKNQSMLRMFYVTMVVISIFIGLDLVSWKFGWLDFTIEIEAVEHTCSSDCKVCNVKFPLADRYDDETVNNETVITEPTSVESTESVTEKFTSPSVTDNVESDNYISN